jgi:ParB family chromosome partitioning protein
MTSTPKPVRRGLGRGLGSLIPTAPPEVVPDPTPGPNGSGPAGDSVRPDDGYVGPGGTSNHGVTSKDGASAV